LYLLTYNHFAKIGGGQYKNLTGKKTATVDTGLRATMNLDAVAIGPPDSGRYLIAAGQDDLCVFYETCGFDLAPDDSNVDSPSQLSLRFQELNKVKSTEAASKSYQLCVRFDRSPSKPLRVATAGTDGYVRIWDAIGFCQNRDPTIERKPLKEFMVEDKKDVSQIDFSYCGSMLLTVGNDVNIWHISTEKKLQALPEIPALPNSKYKCRTVRFVNLNPQSKRAYFVAAHNCRIRNSKQDCKLSLWAFDQEKGTFSSLVVKEVAKDAVSSLTVSNCSSMVAVGTQTGGVFVYDTRSLNVLYSALEAHSAFVTSVEFLPRRTFDTPSMGRIEQSNGNQSAQTFLPGVTSESLISVVSLSIDQQLQLHSVPFPEGISTIGYWMKASCWLFSLYILLWAFLIY
jgi:WD40 repeat protein